MNPQKEKTDALETADALATEESDKTASNIKALLGETDPTPPIPDEWGNPWTYRFTDRKLKLLAADCKPKERHAMRGIFVPEYELTEEDDKALTDAFNHADRAARDKILTDAENRYRQRYRGNPDRVAAAIPKGATQVLLETVRQIELLIWAALDVSAEMTRDYLALDDAIMADPASIREYLFARTRTENRTVYDAKRSAIHGIGMQANPKTVEYVMINSMLGEALSIVCALQHPDLAGALAKAFYVELSVIETYPDKYDTTRKELGRIAETCNTITTAESNAPQKLANIKFAVNRMSQTVYDGIDTHGNNLYVDHTPGKQRKVLMYYEAPHGMDLSPDHWTVADDIGTRWDASGIVNKVGALRGLFISYRELAQDFVTEESRPSSRLIAYIEDLVWTLMSTRILLFGRDNKGNYTKPIKPAGSPIELFAEHWSGPRAQYPYAERGFYVYRAPITYIYARRDIAIRPANYIQILSTSSGLASGTGLYPKIVKEIHILNDPNKKLETRLLRAATVYDGWGVPAKGDATPKQIKRAREDARRGAVALLNKEKALGNIAGYTEQRCGRGNAVNGWILERPKPKEIDTTTSLIDASREGQKN